MIFALAMFKIVLFVSCIVTLGMSCCLHAEDTSLTELAMTLFTDACNRTRLQGVEIYFYSVTGEYWK